MNCLNCSQKLNLLDNRIDMNYCSNRCKQRAYRQRKKGAQLRNYQPSFQLEIEKDGVANPLRLSTNKRNAI